MVFGEAFVANSVLHLLTLVFLFDTLFLKYLNFSRKGLKSQA